MEAKHTSMKWKRPSPSMDISTRTKSQIYHNNRSGLVRNSNGHPGLLSHQSNPKRPRSVEPIIQGSLDGKMPLHSLIKDLRVKRVFSPTSKVLENLTDHHKFGAEFSSYEQENGPKTVKNGGVESSGNGFSRSGPDVDDLESKGTERLDMGFVSKARRTDYLSLKSPVREGIRGISSDAEQRSGDANQDCVQKSSADVKENGVRLNFENKTKLVLKPRQRVFKAPGSFGYRRLLPYLKAEDISCALDFCQHPNLDKGSEGKPFQGMRALKNPPGSLHQFDAHKVSREYHTSGSSTLLENVQVCFQETSNGNERSSESPEFVPASPSITVVDECLSKPPVDGQTEKFDVGFSCKAQKLNASPLSSSAMEDSQVNKDHVIDMHIDCDTPAEDARTSDKAGNGEAQNAEDMNSLSSSMMDECYSCKVNVVGQNCENSNQNHINGQRVNNAVLVLNQIDDSNEESVQRTPPDAEMLGKLEVEVKRVSRAGYVLQTTNQSLGKPSNVFNHTDATCVDVKKQESTPKRKRVLNPCSRLKLFRSPGSVSYRRLLPYLLDIEKNNSCANTSKDLEHRLQPPLTPNQQETLMDQSNDFRFHSEHQICDPGTLPTPQLTSANGSSNYGGDNLTSPEHVAASQMSFDVQKEQHVQQAASGSQSKLETSPDIVSLGHEKDPITLFCPSTCEATSIKDGAISVTNSSSDCPEEDHIGSRIALSSGGKPLPVQADSLCQNSSQIDATVSSGIHADGLRKQILKRNPRGCRGLCTCLNCTSFRLHAERAFEFSRNQMQDAEEVALDLMKELSSLRKMLEMPAVGATTPVMDLNEVKEACRKASEAEENARNRLDEMNYDLNIHCRITCVHGPKVTFANYVEEMSSQKQTFQATSLKP
ncbi:PREDICTED: uncharacterized protein LOC103322628 [Prunus mume]|uniref:Uncharacterized protein LOC103322628 n=1 Tax=Prunus mume TaxID=102107 RepID=A0ABM0NCL3_PRUMU|nr:PREDICTED: uncharacterized protein LOC103322628 [Prunus mume]